MNPRHNAWILLAALSLACGATLMAQNAGTNSPGPASGRRPWTAT